MPAKAPARKGSKTKSIHISNKGKTLVKVQCLLISAKEHRFIFSGAKGDGHEVLPSEMDTSGHKPDAGRLTPQLGRDGVEVTCDIQPHSTLRLDIANEPLNRVASSLGWVFILFNGGNLIGRPLLIETTDVDVDEVKAFAMDVHSKPFIPEELIRINHHMPHTHYAGIPPPAPDYPQLAQSQMPIYPVNLQAYGQIPLLPAIDPIYTPNSSDHHALSLVNYRHHFGNLCAIELGARIQEMEEYNLYDHAIQNLGTKGYMIFVPGITENKPFLRMGDVVRVRRCPAFDGIEYEGYVNAVVRKENKVFLNMPPAFLMLQKTEDFPAFNTPEQHERFNIRFMFNADSIRSSTRALTYLQSLLKFVGNPPQRSLAMKWLFPDVTDCVNLPSGEMPSVGWDFRDNTLNWEQKFAVKSIVKNNYGDVPFVIWRPPGTGKTKTLIEAILQTVEHHPNAHILAVAPSNSAADTIALRLIPHLSPTQMVRLNSPTRTFAEVRDALMPFCMVSTSRQSPNFFNMVNAPHPVGAFFDLDVGRVVRASVVVLTCEDASALFEAGLSNGKVGEVWEIYQREMETFYPLLHPASLGGAKRRHWTHLFVDEAGQASEPALADALSLILTTDTHLRTNNTLPQPQCQFVLCGDMKQLGPFIQSDHARANGLGIPLMERLMARDCYSEDSRRRSTEDRVGDVAVTVLKREAFVRLKYNYRSHAGILMMPSTLFYTTTLEVYAPRKLTHALLPPQNKNLHKIFPTSLPILFWSIVGEEDRAHEGGGWWNVAEALEVKRVVTEMVVKGGVAAGDVGVMCVFREQVRVVRHMLRSNKRLRAVDVGTVEDYQGQERLVTILSTVRSQLRFTEEDAKRGWGVIGQPKTLNVALTRAQAGLVVVGNPDVLMHDPDWRKLMTFYCKHGLNRGYMPKSITDEAARVASPTAGYLPGQLEQGHMYAMHVKQTRQQEWLGSAEEWHAGEEDERALGWSVDAVTEALEEWELENEGGGEVEWEEEVDGVGKFTTAF
ncbi:hypothetical protein HK097_002486 [Rhizophlyctis rosea]|uniref:RNA helicase n=1 Tax=Rhizophlyctis rosea TaxID=64517 RepID=A0AAD5SGV3_9FUNG|nr:hypothetical protein HK097_002486 [Rhizophlyctis rosea]